MLRIHHALPVFSLLLLCSGPVAAADELASADAELLKSLDLPADGPGLVDFFKKRTLRDSDKQKIQALIRKLGDDDFDAREEATRDVIALGAAAKPLLVEALKDKDVEIVRRAEKCLSLAEKTTTTDVLGAAVRQLGRKAAPDAAAVLLDFVPFVVDDGVIDEFGPTLAQTAALGGKPEPLLLKAAADKLTARRAVAAEALGRLAKNDEELRRAARKLLSDADAQVRRRAALGLLAARDREAMPVFINLLAELPLQQTWRIDEVLFDLAGDKPPTLTMSRDSDDGRKKYRDAWLAWWKDNGSKIDVAKLGTAKPYLNYTLVTYIDYSKNLQSKLYELGPDGKTVRWEIEGLQYLQDAQVLPNGNVLVCESRTGKVVEYTQKKEVVWEETFTRNLVISAKRMPNGNTFVVLRNRIVEVDKDKKEVGTPIDRKQNDVLAAARLPAGGAAILTVQGMFMKIDAKGNQIGKTINTASPVYTGSQFDLLPNGHVLIPLYSQNTVVEYNAAGEKVWSCKATQPTCVQRLPNGNTLISSRIYRKVIEVDRTGKETGWSHDIPNTGRMAKASRR